jgi:hypothetical protein
MYVPKHHPTHTNTKNPMINRHPNFARNLNMVYLLLGYTERYIMLRLFVKGLSISANPERQGSDSNTNRPKSEVLPATSRHLGRF